MLVGVSGYARAGKDSFGDALAAQFGFVKASFAAPMKQMAEALDPIVGLSLPGDDLLRLNDLLRHGGWEFAKTHPEVREFLQRLGTEGGRKIFGEDFWVNHTLSQYDDVPLLRVAICDVRFRNEARAIEKRGGTVVRIVRPGCEAPNDHQSEHDLDGCTFDAVIENDGTLDDLEEKAKDYFSALLLAWSVV